MLRYLSLALVLLTINLSLYGQEEDEHTCRIVYLNASPSSPRTLHLFDGSTSQEVDLPRRNLSQIYKLPPGKLKIQLLADPVSDPESVPENAPSATVPAKFTDFYLLVMDDRMNDTVPVSMQVVNANADHVSRGEMLWFNLTDKAITGKIGTEKIALKPAESAVVKEPMQGRGNYPVELYFFVKGDDFMHPLCETQWRHDPRSRSLIFIQNENNRRVPRIFTFSDFRMP